MIDQVPGEKRHRDFLLAVFFGHNEKAFGKGMLEVYIKQRPGAFFMLSVLIIIIEDLYLQNPFHTLKESIPFPLQRKKVTDNNHLFSAQCYKY